MFYILTNFKMTIDYHKNYDIIEEFIIESGISSEVIEFATNYMGLSNGLDAVIDYYDLRDALEEYLKQCGIKC